MDDTPSNPAPYAQGSGIAQATGGSTAIVNSFHAAPPRPIAPAEIAEAEAHLRSLPLDSLPPPAGLPETHVMPRVRNRNFIGRTPDLLAIARCIAEGGPTAIGHSPAITGLGGQGKTSLAVEFAYRYGSWFRGGVFWIACADPIAIPEAIAACAPVLYPDEPGISGRPLPERVARVSSAWSSKLPRLLIFDNCEDEALLEAWLPKTGGCRLLITSRRPRWKAKYGIVALPLGQLTPAESLALLRRHRPDLPANDPTLAAIADELGHLPLALELAGSYLARYRYDSSGTPHAYLIDLRTTNPLAHQSLTITDPEHPDRSRTLTGHEACIARTFELSLDRLDPGNRTDALARRLFATAAWLVPGEPIPRDLLRICAGLPPNDPAAARAFTDALTRLLDLALLEQSADAVILHRLLSAFARARLQDPSSTRNATEMALAAHAQTLLEHNDPSPLRSWSRHLLGVAASAQRDQTEAAAFLLNSAGNYSQLVADLDASEPLLRSALVFAERNGPDHPLVARTLTNLGNVQRLRGDLDAAEASQRRALSINESVYGLDRPQVAITLTNLGIVQQLRGDLDAAEASQRRALTIKEGIYGPDHLQVATTLCNLGIVQQIRGDLDAAETSQRRALTIEENAYGPDHPEVALTLTNLGIVQQLRGDLDAAEASERRALTIKENAYGPDHPLVASTLTNLGIVQRLRGDLDAAEASQRRALTIFKTAYGPDHPDVAIALFNLGLLRQQRGDRTAARTHLTRAAQIFLTKLGEHHPDTQDAQQALRDLDTPPPAPELP